MSRPSSPGAALGAFSHATVGVADIGRAVSFWTNHFGFEVVRAAEGSDPDLAALWRIAPTDIARQALLRTPGATAGALHLVEFTTPAAPVRQNAETFDRLPKNLDIYARDLEKRFEELKAQGLKFRADPVVAPGPDGMIFKEVHLPGHDEINVVLLEVIGKGYDTCFNARGFAGVGPLVTIVPDLAIEETFYTRVLGMAVTLDIRLAGAAIEKMIGLPAGAALLLKVYGDPEEPLGRVEVIEYERSTGRNLFARANAPALGTLHVTYRVADLAPLLDRLGAAGVGHQDHGDRRLLYGAGRVISMRSPAGFRIEVQERPSA
jgi:catechol 2,3-dioxygenase-like lactoylglutathione lyase family enzyme